MKVMTPALLVDSLVVEPGETWETYGIFFLAQQK
jgi:hypothetical protein